MAVDSNFSSLLQNLNLDDPYLPSKPWESIHSESGISHSNSNSSLQQPLYDSSTISEGNLVRLAINALQGVEASLLSIEKLSESFRTDPADRTSHRIPNLWYGSSSTNGLGNILKSIGRSGFIAFLIRKFVEYEKNTHNTCSLVNQAFAVAVEKVLEGFVCALDTLYASVQLRRCPKKFSSSKVAGCLTSVVHCDVTFVEVYFHTKELRTQIESIGNICMFKNVELAFSTRSIEDLSAEATTGFGTFPRGADLLSYLYVQLQDADLVHRGLLKFLFNRSCEPYYGFIKSWIHAATVNDPYKEFIIEYVDGSPSYSRDGANLSATVQLPSIRVREEVSVPYFLENFCLPLLRAGQQLQVLIKLLELCNCVCAGDQAYKDILPCWTGSSSYCFSTISPLTFSKIKMEEMVLMRENMYRTMQEKLHILIAGLDNKYQPIRNNVMPLETVPFVGNISSDTANIPVSCSNDGNFVHPIVDGGHSVSEEGAQKSEISGATDDGMSYLVDPFESSSECSSWNSGEQTETEEPVHLDVRSIETELRYLSASVCFENLSNGDTLPEPSQSEKPSAQEHICHTSYEIRDLFSKCVDPHKVKKPSHIFEHHKSENATWSKFSETAYVDYKSICFWPLGGLSYNPFYDDRRPKGESLSQLIGSSIGVPDRTGEMFVGEAPHSAKLLDDSVPRRAREDIQLETGTHASPNSNIYTSWKPKYNCNVFKMNPMLTKNTWCQMIDKLRGRSFLDHKQICLPYFNFSSVEDPCKIHGNSLIARPDHGFKSDLQTFSDSASTKAVDTCFGEQKYGEPEVPFDHINPFSSNRQEEGALASTSGGAKWESTLSYLGKGSIHANENHKQSSGSTFGIPLDIIIEKCILQEILLQYEYISNFTIKLLEEGCDLRDHLLALRRYHFMEFADWADLFIVSLWRHNWSVAEASEKISEIQGFLDSAVQRSSCEGDPYKERLFLYMKEHGTMPLPTSATGVHAFDSIALGYRVDWPVSIVLTPSALKIYADIFSFLIQVKLAVFSLTDIWCTMKDLVHTSSQNDHSGLNVRDKAHINILMRMRHQVNHFVSTLQQYIQSQLSHVSWCRFLHSLKHQVKDMFDLESVHMAYLADSLHICFLSDEAQPIAAIIESILQCALDFRSCFTNGYLVVGSDCGDSSKILGRLNISQVLTIKATFEKKLKELYVCYLKSQKHGEFSLCRFWGYLNYNDYYSSAIGDGLIHYAL